MSESLEEGQGFSENGDYQKSQNNPKPDEESTENSTHDVTERQTDVDNSVNSVKIKKRTIDGAQRNSFIRKRGAEDITTTNSSQTQVPSWTKPFSGSSVGIVPKPSWIKQEDFEKVHGDDNEVSSTEEGPVRKLKRPSRRSNVKDQVERARVERDREQYEEEKVKREIQSKRQNLDQVVRDHYNQRTFTSRHQKRYLSPIIKLRNFNNAIKYMLINNFSNPGERALDLGCGKGGDINKWTMANISEYVGIDISNASIIEAIKRYRNIHAGFEVTFITGDCFGTPLPEILMDFPQVRLPVDIVSMQFCMHYAYESETKARTMLENVSRSLRSGGKFIGTIPSSDFIKSKISKLEEGSKKFGNSLYSVTFEKDPPRDGVFRPPYGHIYDYYLKDAVENVPEYVVPFESFRALALEYDLELRYRKTFAEIFTEEMPNYIKRLSPKILEGMRRSDGKYGVEGDEKEASAFYLAFAFEKI